MVGDDQGPGTKPINEADIMEMIFSEWGAKMAAFVFLVFGAYAVSLVLFGL